MIDVLSGKFEITAAVMSGQIVTDNFTAMMAFKRAFKFETRAFDNFCEQIMSQADSALLDPARKNSHQNHSSASNASDLQNINELPVTGPTQLQALSDDPELQRAVTYLFIAYDQCSLEINLLCRLTHEGVPLRNLCVCVGADGVQVLCDEDASKATATCTVDCDREVLMQMIRGELDAAAALVAGQVVVDDLGQLMAFKAAFRLERAAFDAYLQRTWRSIT